jgi:pimeloyl-ACP methyl ester carboxylesterase
MLPDALLFADRFKCYLLDPPGSGGSSRPDRADAYRPEDHADWYAEVISALALGRVHLLGASFGGMAALMLSARHPDQVLSCTGVSTPLFGIGVPEDSSDADRSERMLQRHAQAPWYESARNALDAWTAVVLTADSDEEPKRLYEEFLPLYTAHPDAATVRAGLRHSTEGLEINMAAMKVWEGGLYQKADLRPAMTSVRCPVHLLYGAFDWFSGPGQHDWARRLISDITLTIIPDCGHLLSLEEPFRYRAAAVNWLDGVSSLRGSQ